MCILRPKILLPATCTTCTCISRGVEEGGEAEAQRYMPPHCHSSSSLRSQEGIISYASHDDRRRGEERENSAPCKTGVPSRVRIYVRQTDFPVIPPPIIPYMHTPLFPHARPPIPSRATHPCTRVFFFLPACDHELYMVGFGDEPSHEVWGPTKTQTTVTATKQD